MGKNKPLLTKINKSIEGLDKAIKKRKLEDKMTNILKEINPNTLSLFSNKGQKAFKEIYTKMRMVGKSIGTSNEVSLKLISRSFKDKRNLIKSIEKIAKEMEDKIHNPKGEFFVDDNEDLEKGCNYDKKEKE